MSRNKKYCLECFAIMDADLASCPQCGYVQPTEYNPLYLKPPFRLNRQYVIGKVLGHGGSGITYLGFDRHLNTRVAIKEYFPVEFASRAPDGQQVMPYSGDKSELFKLGRDKFIAEARLLASLRSPNIVRIRHFFEECNTAYFIMEYLEGETLSQYVASQGGRIKPEKIKDLLLPLLEALEEVHAKNSFHRDIKPDNVYITSKGQPILLDFGAARQQMSGATTNLLAFLTPGFAPAEQYSTNGIQGPWTDIYALAATMYYALTGQIPPLPHDRMMGDQKLIPPSAMGVAINPKDEEWLIQGLALKWSQRPENIAQWRKMIEAADTPAVPPQSKRSEEENFMRIAILPRLVSRFLTPTAEAEIYESATFMDISRERVQTLIEEALMVTGSTRRDPEAEKRKEQERRQQLEADFKRRQAQDAADEAHRQEQKQEAEKKRQQEEQQRKQAEQERQRKIEAEKRAVEQAQQEAAQRKEVPKQAAKSFSPSPSAGAPPSESPPPKGKPHKPPPATPSPAAPPPTPDVPPAALVKVAPRFTNSMGMDFVLVEPKSTPFQMGKADNYYHVILTRPYYLQTTPVTQGQWRMVMGINPSYFQGDEWRPVEQVSWDDCQIFIQRLNSLKDGNYRLPTEAEWEYACRWGQKTAYGFGDHEEDLLENGWFDRNSEGSTHPVGLKKPNKWGLYDMHGNVWEWTQDRFSAYPSGTFIDPKGSDSGTSRVMRGGSWNLGASYCRAESRNYEIPSYRFQNLGFRLLLEVKI